MKKIEELRGKANEAVYGKEVDTAIKTLAEYQQSGKIDKLGLQKAAKTIQDHPKLITKKGYGYLSDFAEYYLKPTTPLEADPAKDSMASIIFKSIQSKHTHKSLTSARDSATPPKTVDQVMDGIAKGIADGTYKSLSSDKTDKAFSITKNVAVMARYHLDQDKLQEGSSNQQAAAKVKNNLNKEESLLMKLKFTLNNLRH